jgi:ElaB/YqjD/DUF883 family membrane-anchored ribosome-binding protein
MENIVKPREGIERLQAELGSLVESSKSTRIEQVREPLNRARRTGESLKSEAEEQRHRAEAQNAERPVTSVPTPFGLGFLIGTYLDQRH